MTGVSRRQFVAGVGAGTAGAVTLGAAPALAGEAAAPGASDRYGRMFTDLPSFAPADDRVRAALLDIGRPGGIMDARDNLALGPEKLFTDPAQSLVNRDNPFHTAGSTFFAQFVGHDMTFDTTSPLGVPTRPESAPNARTPALDLDSVYGGGPVASQALYAEDGVKLRVESGGRFEDVPRLAGGTAVLADPRNDDNVVVSGLHAAFILCHNRVVDLLRSRGVTTGLFERARQLVTWHYQWIILHEYLPQMIGHGVTYDVLTHGRRWYVPEPGPAFIPVEFQGAAYRFGHSMVRPSYRANRDWVGFIVDPAAGGPDPADLRGGRRAARRFIDWQTFVNFGDGKARPNKRIDRRISTPLFHLPSGSLPQHNLLRHLTWSIPAGQDVARTMGFAPLALPELAGYGLDLEQRTPLWYYLLAEAELVGDGIVLGPTGARIVGEVLVGLIQLDPRSYLRVQPDWTPTLPSRGTDFRLADLLRFARVDPVSRGR